MSAKTKIKKLEKEVTDIKNKVNELTIDINDQDYTIYKKTEWDDKLVKLKILMNDKIPVNETAVTYEMTKLFHNKEKGSFGEDYKNMENFEVPEYLFLKEFKTAKNRQIYSKDPDYLIYKKSIFYSSIDDLFQPYNRPAREFNKKRGLMPYLSYSG